MRAVVCERSFNGAGAYDHEAYVALVAEQLGVTAASLNLDATTLQRQAAGAADISRSLAAAAQNARST